MTFTTLKAAVGLVALLLADQVAATAQHHQHHHLHKKQSHEHLHSQREAPVESIEPRSGKCAFPSGAGLVSITPGSSNAGWAMSPDQACQPDSYCPIACPSGQVMAQWKPNTKYTYPESQYGGLYCDSNGNIQKPFPDSPYCKDGTGTVAAVNKCGSVVAFCQTVLPGNEAMLIPTEVTSSATLAVPDPTYWDSTASHFYINPPGVSVAKGCVWGTESESVGNWAPFVAGANTDSSGQTFVKIGLNPVWQSSGLCGTKPTFGVKIECPDGNCNGLPCSMDGSGVVSADKATGAGGSDFCVVTVPKGGKANIVVYNLDGSSGSSGTTSSKAAPSSSPTSTIKTTSSAAPTSSAVPTTTSTSSAAPTTTTSSTISSASPTSSAVFTSSSATSATSTTSSTTSSTANNFGGIFQENGTSSSSYSRSSPTPTTMPSVLSTTDSSPSATSSTKSEGSGRRQGDAAFAGLVIALVAAGYLL